MFKNCKIGKVGQSYLEKKKKIKHLRIGRFWINSKKELSSRYNIFLKNYVLLGEMCGGGKPASKH